MDANRESGSHTVGAEYETIHPPPPASTVHGPGRHPLRATGGTRSARAPVPILRPAVRKAILQRMLLLRSASLDRIQEISGVREGQVKSFRRELLQSDLPDQLLGRGAGLAFVRELPQGALLYLLVRSLRPERIVETGIRPGYSTMWLLSALEENGTGQLTSLGPGSADGRTTGVRDVTVGQFVAPALRSRWTLALGNTEDHLDQILDQGAPVDLFFYDNGPDADRARFELRNAWKHLSPRGVLLAHHIDANPVWSEFCRLQGVPNTAFDAGPPPMGALAVRGS
jgi:hypothetical protein